MEAPKEPDAAPDGVKRMCVSMAEQIAGDSLGGPRRRPVGFAR